MPILRRQLPVSSPVSAAALAAGAVAVVTGGDRRHAVRARLQDLLGAEDVLLTDSGTSALGLAIAGALRDRAPSTPVALPAYCCYDVATAADWADAAVRLYDIAPQTLGPDEDSLRRTLAAGCGAVVIAHLYGIPADVGAVRGLVDAAGAVLIEDAAQGAGATLGGRRLGALGSVGVLSFGRGKGTTGGGGGALVAGDARGRTIVEWARTRLERAGRGVGALARLTGQWALGRPAVFGIPSRLPFLRLGQTVYRRPAAPRAMAAVHHAVLSRTLGLEPADVATRRAHAERLRRAVPPGVAVPTAPAGGESAYLRFPIVPRRPVESRFLATGAALGVQPGYPRSLADLDGFRRRLVGELPGMPHARELARTLLTLPTHGLLAERDLDALERWLTSLS